MEPPKLAHRLLIRFLRSDLAEEVEGDLEEKFYEELKTKTRFRARLNYWWQVIHYLRPFALRKSNRYPLNPYDMLQNYLKIGVRNLLKNKFFSVINISGMAISIASFLLISLFLYDEFKFDKHVKDHELKFRVYNDYYNEAGFSRKKAMVPPAIGPTLMTEYPEVESYTRFLNFNNPVLFEYGDKKLSEGRGGYADPSIFEMFSLTLLEGDVNTALREPHSIAISRTLKEKYFGSNRAVGQVMQIFNEDFKVSAVFEDFSRHSHLQLNYFIAMEYMNKADPQRMQSWGWSQFHSYIKLKPGSDARLLESKLQRFAERHAWPITKPLGGSYYIPHLMPLEKIHLYAVDHVYDIAVRGNIQTVYIFSATAIFILVIAILNFINLSTARALNRLKEVGVRKVVGAFRSQLIYQFISESSIIALVALLIGVLVTVLVVPALNSFTEKSIPIAAFINPLAIGVLLVFAVVIGVAAGAYPALYISSYRPSQILSNKPSGKSGRTILRKGLVVLQFMLSFFLCMAALIVSEQYTYMRTKDMGFTKENVLALELRGGMTKNLETTKQQFLNHPNVISATMGYGLPGEAYAGDGIKDEATKKDLSISMLIVDHDYIRTLGLHLIAGRDFSKEIPSDEKDAFIMSESGAKLLGYAHAEDVLQHEVSWNRWDAPDSLKKGRVIGVIKDFHLNSLRESISPVVLHIFPFGYSSLTLKIKGENLSETIAHLEKTWKKFNSAWPFEYRFIDDNFDKLYKGEEKLATLFNFFTSFTIFVACLGLFGLVVYSTSQRYKEIGIRKVLGANESALVIQLSKIYVSLIFIAFMVAVPFSYYVAEQWLTKFAFHITITPLLFMKAALLITIIALVTVCTQSLKAARGNPVDALKEQ